MSHLSDRSILLIDGNRTIHEDFHKILCDEGKDSVLVDSAYDDEQALILVQNAISKSKPYIIIYIDLHLFSNSDAIKFLKHIWEIDPAVQIVASIAYSNYSWSKLKEELGHADNFLILNKPFDVSEIRQLTHHLIRKWELKKQTLYQISNLEKQVLHEAAHDHLTGVANRSLLLDRVQQAITKNVCVGVLFTDLDEFKEINTAFGYHLGDTLLQIIADKLRVNIGESASVIRASGDEFIVLIIAETSEAIIQKAHQIYALLSSPSEIEKQRIIVTASAGLSIYPRDGQDAEILIKAADAALSQAKQLGRNNLQVYQSNYNKSLLQRADLITSLRRALENKQFILHYQPLITPAIGKIVGIEALVRWQHPTMGLLSPSHFIPLAEESGTLLPLEEWVLKTACEKARTWQKLLIPDLTIAVNISFHQLRQNNFTEQVQKTLKSIGLEPRYLELEITAHPLLENNIDIKRKMIKLKESGIKLSLDNFGIGYASFNCLKYYPFDQIKINKSIIGGIPFNTYDMAMVEAIISLAKKLNIEVVAAGVEKQEQVEFLFNQHGTQMQGYYFSVPLDEEACARLLKQQTVGVTS